MQRACDGHAAGRWRARNDAQGTRHAGAGTVDDVVFHHDVDCTDQMGSAATQHLYENAAGASSAAIGASRCAPCG